MANGRTSVSVLLKGRFACEMGNQNELMVTEMVFNGIFTNCSPLELAAILSCVVCEGKKAAEPSLAANESLKLVTFLNLDTTLLMESSLVLFIESARD